MKRRVPRLPGDNRPQHQRISRAKCLPVVFVLKPALILIGIDREAGTQGVGQRGVEGSRDVHIRGLAAAFDRATERSLIAIGRGFGVDQDGSAHHVAAEQDALRAAQDFDAVQIEGVVQHPRVRSQVDAVNEDADRRIDGRNRAVDTQATNGEVCKAARQGGVVKGHIRHGNRQIAQVAQLEGVKLFGVEGRDRYRYVLDLRLPLEGGDNHPFQKPDLCRWGRLFRDGLAGVRLRILGHGREGEDTQHHHNRQCPDSKPTYRLELGGVIDEAHEPFDLKRSNRCRGALITACKAPRLSDRPFHVRSGSSRMLPRLSDACKMIRQLQAEDTTFCQRRKGAATECRR